MEDIDREPLGPIFASEIDYDYENEMQEKELWLDEGHFLEQSFLHDVEGNRIAVPQERSLRVHTFLRDINDQAIPLRVRLEVMVDVAKALNYLHTGNPPLLHNDLRRHDSWSNLQSERVLG